MGAEVLASALHVTKIVGRDRCAQADWRAACASCLLEKTEHGEAWRSMEDRNMNMKKSTTQFVLVALLVTVTTITMSSGLTASAQRRPGGVNQMQVNQLLSRITMHWNQFRRSLDSDFTRSRVSNNMSDRMTAFEDAAGRLRERSRQRSAGAEEVRDLL